MTHTTLHAEETPLLAEHLTPECFEEKLQLFEKIMRKKTMIIK